MRYAFGSLLLLLAACPLAAQEPVSSGLLSGLGLAGSAFQQALAAPVGSGVAGPIQPDRDAFTPSTSIAGQGRLIGEASYSFINFRDGTTSHSFPELLVRYGLLPRFEVRLGWNADIGWHAGDISSTTGHSEAAGVGVAHEYQISYGLKAIITQQQQLIPQSALIVQGLTPTGGDFHTSQLMATYVIGWMLPMGFRANAAIRYNYGLEAGDHFSIWAPSALLRVPLGQSLSVQGEYFGVFANGLNAKGVNYASGGAHYLLSQNCEIGARVGFGLNEQAARFFVNAGFALQF
jgi:hypothetical protein